MGKKNPPRQQNFTPLRNQAMPKPNPPVAPTVASLLDSMADGAEYQSIVSLVPDASLDLVGEVTRAMSAIEQIRGRPCLAYIGNVVRRDNGDSGIDATDDLPFAEMIAKVPTDQRKVDVVLATRGGSGDQVSRFVNFLRQRFDEVEFIVPSFCMSAGTLFALSGDKIWMTPRACLGPIDPQVPSKDGRYVPAQALLLLVRQLQQEGDQALQKNLGVPWTAVRLIDSIDKKELGDAISATNYSVLMATQFLVNYKFKNWSVRKSSGDPVTLQYRQQRAEEIANGLANHDRWKNHGHAISRDVLWNEIKLEIDHPDPQFERAIVRLWALCNWVFERTPVLKMIASSNYRYVRQAVTPGATP
jgi:Serine dehydrogenase proteinase